MKKKFLLFLLFITTITNSFGQMKISGAVYADDALTKPLTKVKIIVIDSTQSKTYHTDNHGKFTITPKLNTKQFLIKIEKEGYNPLIFDAEENAKDLVFDVILKRKESLEEENYDGTSKLLLRN